MKRLAAIPLVREPGTAWDYGFGTDVLGRLVEVLSGETLADFFARRIFQPLQMVDTDFHVHKENWNRLVPMYSRPESDRVQRMTGTLQDGFREPPAMYSGGAGLTSTMFDYVRFVRMLANGGELDGERLLSPLTVNLMRSDVLGDLPVVGTLLPAGHGFGLTFAVSKGPVPPRRWVRRVIIAGAARYRDGILD